MDLWEFSWVAYEVVCLIVKIRPGAVGVDVARSLRTK